MDFPFSSVRPMRDVLRVGLVLGIAATLAACKTPSDTAAGAPEAAPQVDAAAQAPKKAAVSPTEWSLLEMSFEEAKAISAQNAQVGDLFHVAGDSVEILKTDAEGKPTKVKAKGHVFLEMTLPDRATALCDEATVTAKEAVLYGGPMMMQRNRVAKSTTESTSFRITDHLRVSGRFELIKPEDLMQTLMASIDPLPLPAQTAELPAPATAAASAPAKGKEKTGAVR